MEIKNHNRIHSLKDSKEENTSEDNRNNERTQQDSSYKWMYSMKPDSISSEGFSMSVAAILVALDAEKYIPIFRKNNFGIRDLSELSNSDLVMLGVDSLQVRNNIAKTFKNIDSNNVVEENFFKAKLDFEDVYAMLDNTCRHLNTIKISLMASRVSIKKDPNPTDVLITPNIYATDVILKSIDKLDDRLKLLDTNLQKFYKKPRVKNNRNKKKMYTVVFGGAIFLLAMSLARSLKDL